MAMRIPENLREMSDDALISDYYNAVRAGCGGRDTRDVVDVCRELAKEIRRRMKRGSGGMA